MDYEDDEKTYSGLITEDDYPSVTFGDSSPDKGSQGEEGDSA